VTRIAVPFHLNEHRGALDLPVAPELTIDEPAPAAARWNALVPLYERLADAVAAVDDGPPTVFAADCCASVGVLAGLHRRGIEPGVVWIDAYGDFNTPETTMSGYIGGTVLALITGRGDDERVGLRLGLAPIPDHRVVLVDARDLDPAEEALIASSGVRHVAAPDLEEVLPAGPLLLHVDLDVIDPASLPGLMFPAAGGIDVDALCRAVAAVAATGRLAATSIACTWHPARVDAAVCRRVVAAVLAAIDPCECWVTGGVPRNLLRGSS
jgi:arginase